MNKMEKATMTRLYCPECNNYLEGGDGECKDCACGWKQPVCEASNEIITVNVFGKADGDYGCLCPHCQRPIFFSDEHADDVRGSQYQHTSRVSIFTDEHCGGWLEISTTARFSRKLFES